MEKIHFILSDRTPSRYLCNQAVYTLEYKSTRMIKKVTCKNCIHILMNKTLVIKDYGIQGKIQVRNMDTEKLIKIGKEINRHMANAHNDKISIKTLLPYMDFKILNEGSLDEAFEIELNGLKYYDEEIGMINDDNSINDIKNNKEKLLSDYEDDFNDWEDNLSICEKISDEDKLLLLSMINKIRANEIIKLNAKLNEEFIDNFEKSMSLMESEYKGFRFEVWEEYTLYFYVDEIKCQYNIWSNCIEFESDENGNTDEVCWDE